jgi:hypothetical protein
LVAADGALANVTTVLGTFAARFGTVKKPVKLPLFAKPGKPFT